MPTLLGEPYAKNWRGAPPGMAANDIAIWHRYLDAQSGGIEKVYYNVRVGGGTAPTEETPTKDILMWLSLTMLKIDAVIEFADEVWIVEVRHDANRSVIGAIMTYLPLWNADKKINKTAKGVVITDSMSPQIKAICELNNISVIVV